MEALRYGTCCQRITQLYLHAHAFIHEQNEPYTCLCPSSRSPYSFTDNRGMEGWVGLVTKAVSKAVYPGPLRDVRRSCSCSNPHNVYVGTDMSGVKCKRCCNKIIRWPTGSVALPWSITNNLDLVF